MACPLGSLKLVGEVQIQGKHRRIAARCAVCRREFLLWVDAILSGRTTDCRCQRNRKYSKAPDVRVQRLGGRYDAIYQRCSNPSNESWPNYGGRVIELRFPSREEFIRWCLVYLRHPTYKGIDIDRKDNDGHYEPHNLRLVPRRVNLSNKRTNTRVPYKGLSVCVSHLWHLLKRDHPTFSFQWQYTTRLAKRLGSGEAVLAYPKQNRRVPKQQPKPDPAILALYGYTT